MLPLRCRPCNVRTETPRKAANCDCESPVCLRASIAGENATCHLPAFISRMDSSSSAPRSRVASWASSSASVRGLVFFEGTANLFQLGTREVVCLGFGVQRQQHQSTFCEADEIALLDMI